MLVILSLVEYAAAIAFAIAQSALFGFSKIFTRKGLFLSSPALGAFYALLPAVVILFFGVVATGGLGALGKINIFIPSVFLLVTLCALTNMNLGRVLLYESIRSLGAARAGQLIASQLIFASLFAALLLGESLTLPITGGTLLIFAGIFTVALTGYDLRHKPPGYNFRRGTITGIATGIVWGYAFIITKELLAVYDAMTASFITIVFAAVYQGIFVLVRVRPVRRIIPERKAMVYFLITGILTSFAFYAFLVALSLGPIVIVAPFASLAPIFTAVVSYLFIQKIEFVDRRLLLASVVVIIGSIVIVMG